MKNIILKVVKNFILAFVLLYTLNILLININIFVPINCFTVGISTILGPCGIFSLVILSYILM